MLHIYQAVHDMQQHDGAQAAPTASTPLLEFPEPAPSTTPGTSPPVSAFQGARRTATALLTASLLGTGVLSMPRACALTGLVPFTALSLLAAAGSHVTAQMLVRASNPRCNTISALCQEFYGARGKTAAAACIVLQQIGACTGYVVVIGDVFGPLLSHWLHLHALREYQVRIALMSVVVLPISLIRDLSGLRFTSAASVVAICAFCAAILVNGLIVLSNPSERREELLPGHAALSGPHALPHDSGCLRGLGLICFAYFYHQNVLAVHSALHRQRGGGAAQEIAQVFSQASLAALGVACSACVAVGIAGYYSFLDETKPDVLADFAVHGTYISSAMNVLRACYGTGLLFAFPMMLWEARVNLYGLLWRGAQEGEQEEPPFSVHVGLTVGLVGLTTLIGCVVKDLGAVFGLVGSSCTPVLAYIIPAMLYESSGQAAKDGRSGLARVVRHLGVAFVLVSVVVWICDVAGAWD
jgi:amino acid permease